MEIKVFANFREICGAKIVTLDLQDEQPVLTVLKLLIKQFPNMQEELLTADEQLKPLIHVFVNGKNIIHLNGLQTTVTRTDQLALFPPVAGG